MKIKFLNIMKRILYRQFSRLKTSQLFLPPHSWFPETRKMKRKIICHVGPTNSGKTYTALNTLAQACNGIYGGPLRLLAWEVQEKLKKKGIRCSLRTGTEIEEVDNYTHISCTIEMCNLEQIFDVAVIDEMQLIGDDERGWAFTQALLGLKSKEIHVCGSPSFLPIIKALASITNDDISIIEYKRLSKLSVSNQALGDFSNILPGDCVIGFSKKLLYEIKNQIETQHRKKCCIVYGSLPPKARKEQATLFSDPSSNYDCLVATDAVGMGLNLSIRRIVFSTLLKYDGYQDRHLNSSEIKQIAGRAGRFKSKYEDGEVTCVNEEDMAYLHSEFPKADEPILKAGFFPTKEHLEFLALIKDLKLTENEIKKFFQEYFFELWDTETDFQAKDFSLGLIMRNFGSVEKFANKIIIFLEKERQQDLDLLPSTPWECTSDLSVLLHTFYQSIIADERENPSLYFICRLNSVIELARILDGIRDPELSFESRLLLSRAPINTDDHTVLYYYTQFVRAYSRNEKVSLQLHLKDQSKPLKSWRATIKQLNHFESLHKVIDLYLWLSWKLKDSFPMQEYAKKQSGICSNVINEILKNSKIQQKTTHNKKRYEKLTSKFI